MQNREVATAIITRTKSKARADESQKEMLNLEVAIEKISGSIPAAKRKATRKVRTEKPHHFKTRQMFQTKLPAMRPSTLPLAVSSILTFSLGSSRADLNMGKGKCRGENQGQGPCQAGGKKRKPNLGRL